MKLRAPGSKPILVRSVPASAAEAAAYRRELERVIDAMHSSVLYFVKAAWRKAGLPLTEADVQALAQDASPEQVLTKAVSKLKRQWQRNFNELAGKATGGFVGKAVSHHDRAFVKGLKDAGFSVKFQTTPKLRDAMADAVTENMKLVRSIPEEYLEQVREKVLESARAGRSMSKLTELLHERYGVARRRAELIARDQNNKVTALVHRLRQKEVGITKARWMHTAASVTPRQEHIEFDGETYDVDIGMFSEEDGEYVWPGTPVNCGCTSMSVVPGYNDNEEED